MGLFCFVTRFVTRSVSSQNSQMRHLTVGFVSGGIPLHISQVDDSNGLIDMVVAPKLAPVAGSIVPIAAIEGENL